MSGKPHQTAIRPVRVEIVAFGRIFEYERRV